MVLKMHLLKRAKNEIVIHIPKEKSKNLERFETFSQNVKDKKNDEIQIKNYLKTI